MAASRSAQKRTSAASNSRSALVWGSLAFCSILAVCSLIALRISAPQNPITMARVATTPPPAQPVIQKPQGASEFEVARLNDAIRDLAAERDRLSARVETLEHSVGDITASISAAKKPVSPPAPTPAPATAEEPKPNIEIAKAAEPPAVAQSPRHAPVPMPVSRPQSFFPLTFPPAADAGKPKSEPQPRIAEDRIPAHVKPVGKIERPGQYAKAAQPSKPKHHKHRRHTVRPAPVAASALLVPPQAMAVKKGPQAPQTQKRPQTQVAHILPQQPEITGAMKTEFGVDLGGETTLDGLRARWASIKGNHGTALEGLRPLVRVREGSRPGTVELHLVAGPLANAGTAARVCAGLQKKGITCRASEFDGQRLSLH